MFNLDVAELDNYYVGEYGWLVHNTGPCSWTSPAGLVYGPDKTYGNRLNHVFQHLGPNPGKSSHTAFNVRNSSELIPLLDEAYSNILKNGIKPLPDDPYTYLVPMGRPVGTNGETTIRMVFMTPGSSEIRTAYPWR